METSGKSIPSRENSKCKVPEGNGSKVFEEQQDGQQASEQRKVGEEEQKVKSERKWGLVGLTVRITAFSE